MGEPALNVGLHLLRALVLRQGSKHAFEGSDLFLRCFRLLVGVLSREVIWREVGQHGNPSALEGYHRAVRRGLEMLNTREPAILRIFWAALHRGSVNWPMRHCVLFAGVSLRVATFDAERRGTAEWQSWTANRAQRLRLLYEGVMFFHYTKQRGCRREYMERAAVVPDH